MCFNSIPKILKLMQLMQFYIQFELIYMYIYIIFNFIIMFYTNKQQWCYCFIILCFAPLWTEQSNKKEPRKTRNRWKQTKRTNCAFVLSYNINVRVCVLVQEYCFLFCFFSLICFCCCVLANLTCSNLFCNHNKL